VSGAAQARPKSAGSLALHSRAPASRHFPSHIVAHIGRDELQRCFGYVPSADYPGRTIGTAAIGAGKRVKDRDGWRLPDLCLKLLQHDF
jgi:hypothetical protein